MGTHELRSTQADPRVQGVVIGRLLLLVRDDQRFREAERPAQLAAQLERVKVLGVQVDGHEADLPGPVEQPADRGPGYRQPPGHLVLGQLVLVVVPGHPEHELLRGPSPRVVGPFCLHGST